MELLRRQAEKTMRHRARRGSSDTQMDLMKSFGIFCVVYAHCFTHGFRFFGRGLVSSVYVIQLFIFCAGYFYHTEQDASPAAGFLKKCCVSYLLPFFVWNFIYGAAYNVLALIMGLRFGSPLSLYTLLIQPWLDNEQFMLNLPAWFLLSLFLVAMVQWAVRRILARFGSGGLLRDLILLFVYFAGSVAAVWLGGAKEHHGPFSMLLRLMVLLPYYQLGILYRAHRGRLPRWAGVPVILAGCAILFLWGGGLGTKMLYARFTGSPAWIVAATACAVLVAAELCRLAAPLLRRSQTVFLLGRSTMYIMLHHLFVIWCIHAALLLVNQAAPLPGFDPAAFQSGIWYRYTAGHPALLVLYLAAGLAIPAGFHLVYEQVLLRLGRSRTPAA